MAPFHLLTPILHCKCSILNQQLHKNEKKTNKFTVINKLISLFQWKMCHFCISQYFNASATETLEVLHIKYKFARDFIGYALIISGLNPRFAFRTALINGVA